VRLHLLRTSLIALAAAAVAAGPAAAHGRDPSLRARAILPADATWAAPFPAAPNTEPAPAPDSVQPVGGFSALVKGPLGSYLAMPDNGFGSKRNSHSFLLRVYAVKVHWRRGDVRVLGAISLRDPDHVIPFKLINDATEERYLTGGDFDVESFRIDRRGTLWFGDEFGPFLLHTDLTGKVLEPPIPLPGVRSRDYPLPGPAPNLASSNGLEGMAISPDGRTLYPTLEGPLADDADKTIRRSFTFDIAKRRYEPGYHIYHVADPTYLVSDLTALDSKRFVSLERDNFQGPAAVHKQAFVVTPRKVALETREVLDELNIADPRGLSLRGPVRPGDFGLGDPFRMLYQTIEAVLPVDRDELAIVNDTNFGSTGRNAALPDYSDFIRVRVPAIARR
jgi:glycerophosphoryl diester phosphodiesterase